MCNKLDAAARHQEVQCSAACGFRTLFAQLIPFEKGKSLK
jgi:hypothetical protein